MPPQRPTDRRLRANLRAFATTSRQANAPEERIAVTSMRSQTKAKAEARKVSLGPSQEPPVVLCLLDLRIKFASFGRRGSANVVMNVLFNTRRSLQLHLPKMTSVGKSQNKKKKKKNKKKGDRSRSSSRGSNSSKGSQSLKDKRGKTVFLWLSCSLPDARSDDGRSH